MQSGELQTWLDKGVRGITSNPSIFAKAMMETSDYESDLRTFIGEGLTIEEAYWALVVDDIKAATAILQPLHESSNGIDGYVSVEVSPTLAHETQQTIEAARSLNDRVAADNVYIKVPATLEGVPAIETLLSEQISINVTLIFSHSRYSAVMEAYIAGLEKAPQDFDLSTISSVASFFISRIDVEVDKRLAAIGTPEALALQGKAAVAQGQLAYKLFLETFSGPRWEALAAKGANVQRPLWASTSTKNPDYPDTLYVDTLIGPHTVNTLPDKTLAAFEDHGSVARTVDASFDDAQATIDALLALGIDLEEVAVQLEEEGVASFAKAFDDVLASLEATAASN